jgi:murein L,D-transpeptidase YafK
MADEVPSTPRAQQIIDDITPALARALRARGLHLGAPIFLRIFKASMDLEVWVQGHTTFQRFRTYKICAVSGGLGPKQQEGDLQGPEGFYLVTPERMNPESQYHLSFDLGYPNAYDLAYGRSGDALMVHGNCVSAGCYAMTDEDVAEIYTLADAALRQGQPAFAVHVFPFRMSQKNLRRFRRAEWLPFWMNLKEGYDLFEKLRRPPQVMVHEQRYIFAKDVVQPLSTMTGRQAPSILRSSVVREQGPASAAPAR